MLNTDFAETERMFLIQVEMEHIYSKSGKYKAK